VTGCSWASAAGGDNANPYEAALTASTVGSLTQRYTLGSSTPPIVADGTLYAATSTGVSAIRASDGSPIWTATLPAGSASGIAEDKASGTVIASAPGTLYGLDAGTGTIRWSDSIPGLTGDLVLDSGKVFEMATAGGNTVIAIDPASGTTLWTSASFQSSNAPSRPIASFGTIYVSFQIPSPVTEAPEGEIASFSETDGSGGVVAAAGGIAVADGALQYVGEVAPNGQLLTGVIDASKTGTAQELWSAPYAGLTADAMNANLIVGTLSSSEISALDTQTGATNWTASLPSSSTISATPVIAGSLVYLVGTDGTNSTLYAFDGTTGTQVAAVPVAGGAATSSQLVVSEGMVFVTVNGAVTAYAPTS
jgi:outer membrane protein assembly factor BamB